MQNENSSIQKLVSEELLDVFIRLGVIVVLAIMCTRIVAPFVSLALWSVVLAVGLYPLHKLIAARLGGKQGRASTVLVLAGLLLIGTPTVMLGGSFAEQVHKVYTNFEAGTLTVAKPKPAVAEWPLVGERIYTAWSAAATNLPDFVHKNRDQLKALSRRALAAATSTAGSIVLFLASPIVAGIIMAYGESGTGAMRRIISRFSGPERGAQLQGLITATVRSVATGVIGVAFIQALILGVGFIFAGVPAAGILAVVVMVLGILQAPALLVTLPVIAYLWMAGDASTTINVVSTIYLFIGGLADNVLKPLLLGRGVDAPMPVILLGALGGMVSGGIVGLFVGAVLLAVGYQLFMDWVTRGSTAEEATAATEAATSSE
jgi:predicted PurR-regulated permease PerM